MYKLTENPFSYDHDLTTTISTHRYYVTALLSKFLYSFIGYQCKIEKGDK